MNNLQNLTALALVPSVSAANTAAATSSTAQWIDTQNLEGDILVSVNIGAITGTITGKLQSATSASGAGAADISGATFAAISAPGSASLVIDANSMPARYLGYVGTIVTGPALVSVVALGGAKTT